jgi:hypothetical protein
VERGVLASLLARGVLLGGWSGVRQLILPALLEAKDPGFRSIKYALFPPLGETVDRPTIV